jgi:enoyl reductase-like protein
MQGLLFIIDLFFFCFVIILLLNWSYMKTRITELLNIEFPIILPGMSWISKPELVAAASNAGGLGILVMGPLTPEAVRASIQKIKELTVSLCSEMLGIIIIN